MSAEIKQELRRFAENTTIKGVGRSIKATRRAIRVFWVLASLSCLGLLIYQVSTIVLNYSKHTVIGNSGVVQQTPIFPDVTVCSAFPLSDLSRLPFLPDFKRKLQAVDYYIQNNPALNRSLNLQSSLLNQLGNIYEYQFNTPVFTANISDNNIMVYDYSSAGCTWYSRLVVPLQWCQTYACDGSNRGYLDTIFTNNQYQIDLEYLDWSDLELESDYFTVVFALYVMVHPRGSVPLYPFNGLQITTGTIATINIQQTNVTRLEEPWGNCSNQRTVSGTLLWGGSLVYNANSCQQICNQRRTVIRCGCLDHRLAFTDDELLAANHTFCANVTDLLDTFGEEDGRSIDVDLLTEAVNRLNCLNDTDDDDDDDDDFVCDCRPLCSEVHYDAITVTNVQMDSVYQYNFAAQLQSIGELNRYLEMDTFSIYNTILNDSQYQSKITTLNQLRNVTLIRDNFVELTVQFADANSVQTVTDIPAMTWDTLASNLGGSFNLWLAISVPTLAEIVELLYMVLTIWFEKRKRRTAVVSVETGDDKQARDDIGEIRKIGVVSLDMEDDDGKLLNNANGVITSMGNDVSCVNRNNSSTKWSKSLSWPMTSGLYATEEHIANRFFLPGFDWRDEKGLSLDKDDLKQLLDFLDGKKAA